MNKFLPLLFPVLLISQEKLETQIIDFNKTGNGYPHAITETNNQKYILANLQDSIPLIFKFSETDQKLNYVYDVNGYNLFRSKKLYPLKEKIIFQNETYPYSLNSFDGNKITYLEYNFSSKSLHNFIQNDNGYFFLNKDSYYKNKLFFTDGNKMNELSFNEYYYTDLQLHFASTQELIYSAKTNDTVILNTYNIDTKKSKQIAKQFVRGNFKKSVEYFNNKLLFALKENDDNYVYQQTNSNSISKLNLLVNKNDSLLDTIPVKVKGDFNGFKFNNNLFFSGNIQNDYTKLYKLDANNKLDIFAELHYNNSYYSVDDRSKYFLKDNKIFFTAYKNLEDKIGSLWVTEGEIGTTKLIKGDFNLPLDNFFIVNNHLYYQDKTALFKLNLSNLNLVKLTNAFSEVTYSYLLNNTIYFSATEAIHGNELYTLNTLNDEVNFFKEFNYKENTAVRQLLQSKDGIYFISDNALHLYNDTGFEKVSESSPLLITSFYKNPENYKEVAEFKDKLLFISLDNQLISFNKSNKTITNLGYINYEGNEYNFNKSFLQVNDKLYFIGLNSSNSRVLKMTDGTLDGTFTIEESNSHNYSPNHLTYNKNTDRVYFTGTNKLGKTTIYSTKGVKNDFIEEYNSNESDVKIVGTYKDYIVVNIYESLVGYNLYLFKDKQLTYKLPLEFRNHYISSFYNDDKKMYFLYNNRLSESDGTDIGTKEIFQSNFERLFNLHKCGNSFYFEDENRRQIFRSTNYKTQLLKKLDVDHKVISNVCHNNIMFYTNTDNRDLTTYIQKKDYLIASTDQSYLDLEINHILKNDNNYTFTTITEIAAFNNKILLKYNASFVNDQSLFLGDLTNFSLDTNDINNGILKSTKIQVYPNPSKNFINIKVDNNKTIQKTTLYNTIGLKILTQQFPGNVIDISQLSKGIYFIQIETDEIIETKKIIKN